MSHSSVAIGMPVSRGLSHGRRQLHILFMLKSQSCEDTFRERYRQGLSTGGVANEPA